MGIMDRLRGGSKSGNGGEPEAEPAGNGRPEGVPLGVNATEAVLTITDAAKEKIHAVLETQSPAVTTIRIGSPYRGKYAMNLEPEGKPDRDDTVLPFDGFEVYVDSQSLPLSRGRPSITSKRTAGAASSSRTRTTSRRRSARRSR